MYLKNIIISFLKYIGLLKPVKRISRSYYIHLSRIPTLSLDKIVNFSSNRVIIENYHLGSRGDYGCTKAMLSARLFDISGQRRFLSLAHMKVTPHI